VRLGNRLDHLLAEALGVRAELGRDLLDVVLRAEGLVLEDQAFINTRSMTPLNLSSAPMGSCRGTAFLPSLVRIWVTTESKFAPTRSILLMNAMRGTPYLSAWRHTVSDCGSTPPTAQKTPTAPSRTRSERSTSTVKST
jgi:hypothetical protein